MDIKKNKLPLKLIFGIVVMFIVFAFSMAITSKTSAQQSATDTPTATLTATAAATESPAATSTPAAGQNQTSPTSTPDAGATQSPSTGATSTPGTTGSTGSIPVTGANQAPNTARALAFSRAVNRLSNVSDTSLEDRYNELLAKLRREERMLNNVTNKLNRFTNQLGQNAFNGNNNANSNANNNANNNGNNNAQNQNGLNASDRRNRHLQAVQQEFLTLSRNVAIARQQVLLAQIALNSRASFNADGNLNSRQAAINALALAEISLDRGMAAIKQVNDIAEAR